MLLTLDTIKENLNILERAKDVFKILVDYQNVLKSLRTSSDNELQNKELEISREINRYDLSKYSDFIRFINKTETNGQKIIYDEKIKTKTFQKVLGDNAIDESVKKSLRNKNAKTMQILMNSEKWLKFSGYQNGRGRLRLNDNISKSEALIANFLHQQEVDLENLAYSRLSKYYTSLLPEPDHSILDEMNRTKFVIDLLIQKITESGLDFRKLNSRALVDNISEELKKRILNIDFNESVKCISKPDTYGVTVGNIYKVIDRNLDYSGNLRILIKNDYGTSVNCSFKFFETLNTLRSSMLKDLFD
jgi:hypothetical protein